MSILIFVSTVVKYDQPFPLCYFSNMNTETKNTLDAGNVQPNTDKYTIFGLFSIFVPW